MRNKYRSNETVSVFPFIVNKTPSSWWHTHIHTQCISQQKSIHLFVRHQISEHQCSALGAWWNPVAVFLQRSPTDTTEDICLPRTMWKQFRQIFSLLVQGLSWHHSLTALVLLKESQSAKPSFYYQKWDDLKCKRCFCCEKNIVLWY